MRTFHVVLSIMLLAVAAAPARADGFVTPFYGFNFGGDSSNCETFSNCEDKRSNFGVSIGTMGPVFGFEEDISMRQGFLRQGARRRQLGVHVDEQPADRGRRGPVQPYFLVGAGLIRPHASSDLRKFDTKQQLARLRPGRRRERLLQPPCGHPRRRAALSRAAGSQRSGVRRRSRGRDAIRDAEARFLAGKRRRCRCVSNGS